MSIRVVVADDHTIVRQGLRSLLEDEPDIKVVGEADDGRSAVDVVQELKPDVVVMDLAMPGMNGVEATRQIRTSQPSVKVIALSMYSDEGFVHGVLDAGAAGYLLKDCAVEELANAVRLAMEGGTYLSPGVARTVVDGYVRQLKQEEGSKLSLLSQREREVLQLIAEGASAKEIAFTLGSSVKTVETQRRRIMEKLDVHNVAALVKLAIREGLTTLDDHMPPHP
ncbi:MAG: response regulator transcription factor [Chloroflexota bacterium]|nr:response regulator transcription factor [Chloroflexota bacterium]